MFNRKVTACIATLVLGFATLAAHAATQESNFAQRHFNPKVSAWAEGTLMSVDADSSKFSIRGAKSPFETAYAKMLQEINEKTVKMGPEEKVKATADIRTSWNDKLTKARAEKPSADSDFSFRLPGKDNTLHFYDETSVKRGEHREIVGTDAKLSEKEQNAMMALKGMKVGDHVVVGFDDGVVFNDAFIVIKTSGPHLMRDTVSK